MMARHPFVPQDKSRRRRVIVVVGIHDRCREEGQEFVVSEDVVHADYNYDNYDNDIAILKVTSQHHYYNLPSCHEISSSTNEFGLLASLTGRLVRSNQLSKSFY